MERIRTVTGTGPVYVDDTAAGHCAFEINLYRDGRGHIVGHGHVMGDSLLLGKMARGQHIEVASQDDGRRFSLATGAWNPGDRTMDVETAGNIVH
ncbi:MAG: hypothetical protein KL863_09320 [Rhizobium sp.]|nr:hypothetical protein [Rhizobium sp.]